MLFRKSQWCKKTQNDGLIQMRWSGKGFLDRHMMPWIKLYEHLGEEYISHRQQQTQGPVVGKELYHRTCKARAELAKEDALRHSVSRQAWVTQYIVVSLFWEFGLFSLFRSETISVSFLDSSSLLLWRITGQLFCTVFFSVGLSAFSSWLD